MAEKNNANRLKNLLGSAAAPVRPAQEVVVAAEQPPAVEAEPPIRGQGYQTGYQDTEIALRPTASQLSVPLQEIARHYVGARRRSGEAVLDSARWLSEARSLAEHGEWYTFLEATGTSEDTAETLLNLHRRAMSDGRFAEAVRLNWLGQSAAGLLARPTTPPEVVAEVLSADAPPKVEAIRRKIKQAKAGQSQAAVPAQIPEFPGFASVQGDAAQIPEIPDLDILWTCLRKPRKFRDLDIMLQRVYQCCPLPTRWPCCIRWPTPLLCSPKRLTRSPPRWRCSKRWSAPSSRWAHFVVPYVSVARLAVAFNGAATLCWAMLRTVEHARFERIDCGAATIPFQV